MNVRFLDEEFDAMEESLGELTGKSVKKPEDIFRDLALNLGIKYKKKGFVTRKSVDKDSVLIGINNKRKHNVVIKSEKGNFVVAVKNARMSARSFKTLDELTDFIVNLK